MAKKKKDEIIYNETILERTMEEVVHESMMPYAEYVILERALPRVEDGLKPVQRRILYTMHELGLTPDKPYKKCARVVGECLGKYHPHGDTSVYDALVRLAQPFNMGQVLVDGHGNFGSIDGDRAAAVRYTESRMAPLALEVLTDIEKNTVDFRLNFDDSLKEPEMLPGRFPNLLVNGAMGIAVGLATNIPTHNLGEAIDGVIAQIDNPNITTKELLEYVKAPDFPTGGIIVGGDSLESIYETGRGKLQVRAKIEMEPSNAGRSMIVISEVPFQVNKAAMLAGIHKLYEEKKGVLSGIYDIRDESDRTGMRAVIELRKDAQVDKILAYLYKYSDLQVTYGVNMVAIADGKPMQLGLRQINDYYIRHRKNVVTRATQYDLDLAKKRAHVLEGLIVAVDNIDEVIHIIRTSKTPKDARESLMIRFALSEAQGQAILDLRLQRLTNLEILNLENEFKQLQKTIKRLEGILASEKKLMTVIKDQLLEVKEKFNRPRKTKIDLSADLMDVEIEKEQAYQTVVTMNDQGVFKRWQPKLFAKRDEENDLIKTTLDVMSNTKVLIFTNQGNCYTMEAQQIPEVKTNKDRGTAYTAMLPGLGDKEAPVSMIYQDEKDTGYLFYTESGQVKLTAASEYGARKGKTAAISLKGGDMLVSVEKADGESDIVMITELGMSIRFKQDEVPQNGRATAGVKGMTVDKGSDRVVFASQLKKDDNIVLFTDKGYGKRAIALDYERQKRAGKGVKCITFLKNGSTGTRLAGVVSVSSGQSVAVAQKSGFVTKLLLEEILVETKASKGEPYVVIVMDDEVTGVMKI